MIQCKHRNKYCKRKTNNISTVFVGTAGIRLLVYILSAENSFFIEFSFKMN